MKTNSNIERVLVLGSTGKTGSRVLSRLKAFGVPVRHGSRSADIPFDWSNQETWAQVVDGVSAIYITFQPDLAVPGSDTSIDVLTKLAIEKGVKKLVLLSGRGEPEAERCENIVKASGLEWTIVRASWFMQNFTESHLLDPILAGHVALPVGDVGEPFIDADDIADVAVASIVEEGHNGKLYEVTGPELITFKEAVERISKALDRQINYEQLPLEDYIGIVESYGISKEYSSLLSYLFHEVLDGRNESIAHGVEEALGRKPKDFDSFIWKTVASKVWEQPVENA